MCLSFDYGQRHVRELASAAEVANAAGLEHHIINLTSITELLTGSALTDPSVDVPEGHYAEETMKATVVPNRNAMMLEAAIAVAVARKAHAVVTGVHAGDHAVYPDCRPLFISSLNQLAKVANEGFILPSFEVVAPFINMSKADIVQLGVELGVPFEFTWTCYKGGSRHCGRCSTCVERLEAFHVAGRTDPVEYIDETYWRTVV
jgi:7-cyano-7-deazaguanine synthase